MNSKNRFIKQLSKISSLTMLSRIFGFSREIVQLSYIGIGAISDAFTAALMMPGIIRKLTSEGLFNSAFIPIYYKIKDEHNEKEADIWASNILFLVFLSSAVILIIYELLAQYFLIIFNSGFLQKNTWPLLMTLSRILFISIIGSSCSSLLNTIWTAKQNYFLASIGSTICNISIIIFTLFSTNIYQIAIGTTIGTYVQFFAIAFPLRKNIYFKRSQYKFYTTKFIKLILPLLLSVFLLQYLGVISAWCGSWLKAGQLTYINKADKLLLLPISLIGIALSTILMPTIMRKKHSAYVTFSYKIGFILANFILAHVFILHNELALLVFNFGKITINDTNQIGGVLFLLGFGIPAWITIKVFHTSLASIHDTKGNLYGNIIHVSIYSILVLLAIKNITMHTMALISVISVWANFIFIFFRVKNKKLIGKIGKFTLAVVIANIFFILTNIFCINITHYIIKIVFTIIYFSICYFLLYKFLYKMKL